MNKETKKVIHIVPNFHYDVEYLKTYEEYRDVCLDNIVQAIRLLINNPEYRFMVEQVILLQEFWERYPHFRSELRQLVRQGRLEIACGMYCMPDMNLPSGESLIEQVARGKQWIKENLQADVRVCWIADCFGQHPQLPQIIKKCGYDYYFFSRGATENEQGDFLWQGIDGTKILTHRGPKAYSTLILRSGEVENAADLIIAKADGQQAVLNAIAPVEPHCATPDILCCNGGDFMPPQPGVIDIVHGWDCDEYDCRFSTARDYFQSIENQTADMPCYREDFNPVNQGCYSSRIKIKMYNRAMENALLTAERLKLLCKLNGLSQLSQNGLGRKSAQIEAAIDEATRLTLYNQFHDIICGSIVDQAYLDCLQRYKNAVRLVHSAIDSTFDLLVEDKESDGGRFVNVLNPSAYKRKETVELVLDLPDPGKTDLHLYDELDRSIPLQQLEPAGSQQIRALFSAEVGGMCMNSYRIELRDENKQSHAPAASLSEPFVFSNDFYTVQIEKNGIISSLKTHAGEELVDAQRPWFNDLLMQSDYGDLWVYSDSPHNGGYFCRTVRQAPYLTENRGFLNECFGHSKNSNSTAELIENGPERYTIQVKTTVSFWRIELECTQYIHLYKYSPRIDFKTAVKCSGRNYRLRACFPTSIRGGTIEHEIPFGFCKRREEEYAAMNWISYRQGNKGLLLFNKGLPGNNVHDGVMMLSLMRSTTMDYKAESDLALEQGESFDFEYSILPYDGNLVKATPWRHGENFNLPFVVRMYAGKPELPSAPIISVDKENVMISKISDTENGMLVRLYEAGGVGADCVVSLRQGEFTGYTETDCLTNSIGTENKISGNGVKLTLKPFEIKTFLFTKQK